MLRGSVRRRSAATFRGWMRRVVSSLDRSQGCCVGKTRMYFEVRRTAQRRTSKASRNSGTLPSGTSTSSSALKTVKLLASGPSYQPCRSGSQPRIHWLHEVCLGPEACLSMGLSQHTAITTGTACVPKRESSTVSCLVIPFMPVPVVPGVLREHARGLQLARTRCSWLGLGSRMSMSRPRVTVSIAHCT